MIKRTLWAALAVAVGGLIGAAPADAQEFQPYKFDIGVNGGFAWYSDMLDDTHLGEDAEDVKFESGWLTGAQLTFWATPNFGIRANGTYTERPLVEGSFDELSGDESTNIREDINLWTVSGDLMIRPWGEGYMMGGVQSLPFLALGAGGFYADVSDEQDLGNNYRGFSFTAGVDPAAQEEFLFVEEWKLMGLVALGTDLRFANNFALRLELGDRIFDAPLRDAEEFETNPDEDRGKVTHMVYAQIGAHLLLGVEDREVVAVAPAPPPPAPEPEPEPEPEPVEESIMVCVIDPDTEYGLVEMEAIYLPETRDTMVMRDGMRRDFGTVVPDVMLANEADWFVRGEPLTINIGPGATIEYTTWQSARMIDADQVMMIGTSRGLPVYASRDDIAGFSADWEAARDAAMSDELDDILEENAELAAELEEIQYLYVPLRATGCVFQTVEMVEQVRKK
ncbi:MAG: hypothetical protein ACOC3J_00675 [Gemmatimonadota bacterium]